MKTTVDIPDTLLQELLDNTHASTKRAAILTAIEDYNRKKRMTAVADIIGTLEQFITSDELAKSRESD